MNRSFAIRLIPPPLHRGYERRRMEVKPSSLAVVTLEWFFLLWLTKLIEKGGREREGKRAKEEKEKELENESRERERKGNK